MSRPSRCVGIGVIGAGLYASSTMLPVLGSIQHATLRGLCTGRGISAQHHTKKWGFEYCTTDHRKLLEDDAIDVVMILTRHDSHASLATDAIRAGKHVFVEKPMALDSEQLEMLVQVYEQDDRQPVFFVGFNRRFSPLVRWLKPKLRLLSEPLMASYVVNAGKVPPDHWVHDRRQGGGRIIGEVCHFVDLVGFLLGSKPVRVYAESLHNQTYKQSDNAEITMAMSDGSTASILYAAGGSKRVSRETIMVLGGGAVGMIDSFRRASFTRGLRVQHKRRWGRIAWGYREEITALLDAVRRGEPSYSDFQDYAATTRATFAIEESLRTASPVILQEEIRGT